MPSKEHRELKKILEPQDKPISSLKIACMNNIMGFST